MPKLRCNPRSVARARASIKPMLSAAGTPLSGMWVVTGTVRKLGPTSIIATLPGEIPQRSATNSVWPGWEKPIA